jgi:hypothetical protein
MVWYAYGCRILPKEKRLRVYSYAVRLEKAYTQFQEIKSKVSYAFT